jgi:hypothetical protein
MNKRPAQFATLYLIGLLATAAVTVAAFWLTGDGFENHSTNWWITLSTLLWAQVLSFGFAIAWSLRGSNTNTFPYNFAAVSILVIYDLAVVLLAFIALTSISPEWLGTMHLSVFLLALLGLIAYFAGGMMVSDIADEEVNQRVAYSGIVAQAQALVDMSARFQGDGAAHINQALAAFREEVDYITADTVPGTEAAEAAVTQQLRAVQEMLTGLTGDVLEDDTVLVPFDRQMQQLAIAVKQREAAMLAART